MPTNYPNQLDNFPNPGPVDNLDTVGLFHDEQHANANDAIEALQARVGTLNSMAPGSIEYRLSQSNTLISSDAVMVPLTIKGTVAQSGHLLRFLDTTGAVISFVNASGDVVAPAIRTPALTDINNAVGWLDMGGELTNGSITVKNKVPGNVSFAVRAVAAQTKDIQQWQDPTGVSLAGVTSDGILYSNKSGNAISLGVNSVLSLQGITGPRFEVNASSVNVGNSAMDFPANFYGQIIQVANDNAIISQTKDSTHNIFSILRRYTNAGLTTYNDLRLTTAGSVSRLSSYSNSTGAINTDFSFFEGRFSFNWGTDTPIPDLIVIRNKTGTEVARFTETGRLGVGLTPGYTLDVLSGIGVPAFRLGAVAAPFAFSVTPAGVSQAVIASGASYTAANSVAQAPAATQLEFSGQAINFYSDASLATGSNYSRTLRFQWKDATDGLRILGPVQVVGNNNSYLVSDSSATPVIRGWFGIRTDITSSSTDVAIGTQGGRIRAFIGLSEQLLLDTSGVTLNNNQTSLWVRHNDSLKRVQVGAADSGGTGFRMLRISN